MLFLQFEKKGDWIASNRLNQIWTSDDGWTAMTLWDMGVENVLNEKSQVMISNG